MPKFDARTVERSAPDTRTAQGGQGFSRSLKQELVLLGASNAVSEHTFYESARSRDDRFESLVRQATVADPQWTAEFVAWLRQDAGMRSASLVAAAVYVEAGGPRGADVVEAAVQRPDEPGEMLALWNARHNGKRRTIHFPKPIKRGVARSASRLYSERASFKYDGQSKNWRFADVVGLTRPKPKSALQSDLFGHLIADRRGKIDGPESISENLVGIRTDYDLLHLDVSERLGALDEAIEIGWPWERISGWVPGGLTAEVWEAAIPNMGVIALVKNLRNFDEANISASAVDAVKERLTDAVAIRQSKIFPIRLYSAWRNVASTRWGDALETALDHTLLNVPELDGRTLVLLDVSSSMKDDILSKDKGYVGYGPRRINNRPLRWEGAGLVAMAIAKRANDAEIVLFNTTPLARFRPSASESILRRLENLEQFVGGGTDTLGALAAHYKNHDRVIIITDEQTGPRYHQSSEYVRMTDRLTYQWTPRTKWDAVKDIKVPVITFNMAGYPVGHTPVEGNWTTLGGLSDASFGVLDRGDIEAPWRS